MNEEIAKPISLTRAHVDAGGLGSALVGPHGEHPLAEIAAAEVGHPHPEHHRYHDAQ